MAATPINRHENQHILNLKATQTTGNASIFNQKTSSSNVNTVISGANLINKDKNGVRRIKN